MKVENQTDAFTLNKVIKLASVLRMRFRQRSYNVLLVLWNIEMVERLGIPYDILYEVDVELYYSSNQQDIEPNKRISYATSCRPN